MNVRAILPIIGLLSLLAVACGGGDGDADALALSAVPGSTTLPVGGTAEVTVTLTRRGADGPATLSATGLPTGVTATFAPAELAEDAHTSVLTLEASATAAPGSHAIRIQVTGGAQSGALELPIEVVTASVSGTISFQSGLPLTTAIVEVPGRRAVIVDEDGAFEIPEVNPPYDLRVSWPEAGSIHLYRGLEDRHVELRPFDDNRRPEQQSADYEVTITNWVPGSDFVPWIYSEEQPVQLEWSSIPDAAGWFIGSARYLATGPAALQGLALGRDANRVVNAYRGFLNAPVLLDQEGSAKGLSFALEPVESFGFLPEVHAASGLSLSQVCPVVEQPQVARELFCNDAEDGLPLLPELPSGELTVLMEYANANGAISRRAVRGVTAEGNAPTVTFAAPPVLESPASGASMERTDAFLVAVDGDAPITLTLWRRAPLQEFHITTREREIPLPDFGQFIPYPDGTGWEWMVRALPDASGWEVLEDGGVIGIQARVDKGLGGSPLGAQPHTTRSESRPVSIGW